MAEMNASFSNKDVTVEQMDYSYIEKCSNEKELARILRSLRSGREGFYPDLIEFCEKKLRSMNPDHRALRQQKPILKAWDLGQEDLDTLSKDMEHWTSHMKTADEQTTEKKIFESNLQGNRVNGFEDRGDLPPVRDSKVIKGSKAKAVGDGKTTNPDRIKSSDYKAWDKYDVEQECEKLDKQASKPASGPKAVNISRNIDASNLSGEEKRMKAIKEKEKGNEAFKSGDFEEALSYYCRSLCLHPIAASYNNRALVYLRLEKWEDAVSDCNTVLQFEGEGNNLKALLRRATAYKSLRRYDDATSDIQFVLEKEPNNARAKSILDSIQKSLSVQSEQPYEDENKTMADAPAEKRAKKMVIMEVEGESSDENENLIKINNDDSPSQKSTTQGKSGSNNNDAMDCDGNKAYEQASATITSGKVANHATEAENVEQNKSNIVSEKDGATVSKMVSSMQDVNPVFPPKTAELKAKAAQFFKAGRYSEACESYSKAISSLASFLKRDDVDPCHKVASAVLHNNRAACRLKQGDDRACIEDCNKVLQIKSWDMKAFMRRAAAYENIEKYANAWVDYQSAYSMDWQNSYAQNGANRMSNHLREIHGGKWREKVPKVEAYPYQSMMHYSNTTLLQSQEPPNATSKKLTVQTEMDAKSKESPVNQSMQKVEVKDLSKTGNSKVVKPSPKQSPPKETKRKQKNKKRNKSKSKSPQRIETPTPTVEEEEKEIKRMKIRQDLFLKLKSEGNDFVKGGKYKEAIASYTKCLSLCPKEPPSYTNRALCFLKLKKHLSAINDCTEAIKLDPCNVKAYYRRAQARKAEGYHEDALRDVKKLLEIDPGNKAGQNELESLKKLTHQADNCTTEVKKKPEMVQKKKMIIEEVDSSDSSDEAEFVLPEENFQSTVDKPKSNVSDKPTLDVTLGNSSVAVKDPPTQPPEVQQAQNTEDKATSLLAAKDVPKVNEPSQKRPSSSGPSVNVRLQENKPLTPYEFGNLWSAIVSKENYDEYKALLQRVSPSELPTLLSNKIDDHVITMVARVALEEITVKNNCRHAYDMLCHLTKAQRFSMAAMFLGDSDKKVLKEALLAIRKYDSVSTNEVDTLGKKYGL